MIPAGFLNLSEFSKNVLKLSFSTVVASAVGGIPEIIGEHGNGYLFNKHDVNDLTKKLFYFI